MMDMTDTAKKIFKYLKECQLHKQDVTADDVVDALGLTRYQVDNTFIAAFQRKGLGRRDRKTITSKNGNLKVMYLRLTDKGLQLDPEAEE